jgi:hypothetical protein
VSRDEVAAGRNERTARYAELRDQGHTTFDAADEIGIKEWTRERYERWYRELRGLPRREQKAPPR